MPYPPRLIAFMEARLSREGVLGLHLTVGALILIGAAWLFGYLVEEVAGSEALTLLDQRIAAALHAWATPSITAAMSAASYLGASSVTLAIAAIAGLALWRRGDRYRLLTLALAVPGGQLLNVLVKYVVHRPRPIFEEPLLTLETYSFPSGHAMAATVLYGALAVFAIRTTQDNRRRVLAGFIAGAVIALVCFSRVYLGVHYLSDVLGGIVEGVAWLALCFTAVETFRRHKLHGGIRR